MSIKEYKTFDTEKYQNIENKRCDNCDYAKKPTGSHPCYGCYNKKYWRPKNDKN